MLRNLKISKKIGASFALGLAIFSTIGFIAYQGTTQIVETSHKEKDTYQVLNQLEGLITKIKDAETGQRGYIITGRDSYLQPYNESLKTVDREIKDIQELTKSNPNQQRRLETLEQKIHGKLAELQETIELRRTKGFFAASAVVLTDRGKNLMDEIRQTVGLMENEERGLLDERSRQAKTAANRTFYSLGFGIPLSFGLLSLIGFTLSRHISEPLRRLSSVTEKLGSGDLSVNVTGIEREDEIGILAQAFNQMIVSLRETTQKNEEQAWLKSNLAKFSQMLQGQRDLAIVARSILSELAPVTGASHGVFYLMDAETSILKLLGSYAYQERKHLANQFRLGEGLVGQCALEKQKIALSQVPSDYIKINSGLGEATPLNILVVPVIFESEVIAVIELASFQHWNQIHLTFIDQVTDTIGIVLKAIAADVRRQELLQQSQALTLELQTQQAELQKSNISLEEKTNSLQASEELLQLQQEELQQNNEELQQLNAELEERTELLAVEKQAAEQKNRELEQMQTSLEEQAEELALSSKYKSEFLANMSHELRTPLNSLLILAKLLKDNSQGNLSLKQVEYSQTIYASGTDLLGLINDILDLAKIESGTMSIENNYLALAELQASIQRTFLEVAQQKGLQFIVELDPDLPKTIYTDSKRLQQVLKNLLSNALKFTEQGEVRLRIGMATQGWNPRTQTLQNAPHVVAFSVSDTGIGIAPEQQKIIFEAFQQADGTTSRKYGGTGLGLSISREIARLLDGEISLTSRPRVGSTFTFYLPQESVAVGSERVGDRGSGGVGEWGNGTIDSIEQQEIIESPLSSPTPSLLPSPRSPLTPQLLIVEDDLNFARILMDMAEAADFEGIVAHNGNAGLALAQQLKPAAILLDIRLPGMDGWTVLDRLKHDPTTRHIPVHIISVEEGRQRSLQQGAIAYLQKPVTADAITDALAEIKVFIERRVKNLLVIEDDDIQRRSIVDLIGNSDVATTAVRTGAEALSAISSLRFDCVVLDLGLPDMNGFELMEQIKRQSNNHLPIIVYTGRELTRSQETELKRMAETIIVKDVRSPERLLDETALFLHRIQANLPESKRQILQRLESKDPVLAGKKVLIVDDDVRNIFALTSMLEQYEMQVTYAENGREGIEILNDTPGVDLVLMDVMMPEMDGYETMQLIRQQNQFKSLPIIALTAKAMQGDREKCITAGASDYITKPVDNDQLLSLLRVWLYR